MFFLVKEPLEVACVIVVETCGRGYLRTVRGFSQQESVGLGQRVRWSQILIVSHFNFIQKGNREWSSEKTFAVGKMRIWIWSAGRSRPCWCWICGRGIFRGTGILYVNWHVHRILRVAQKELFCVFSIEEDCWGQRSPTLLNGDNYYRSLPSP